MTRRSLFLVALWTPFCCLIAAWCSKSIGFGFARGMLVIAVALPHAHLTTNSVLGLAVMLYGLSAWAVAWRSKDVPVGRWFR